MKSTRFAACVVAAALMAGAQATTIVRLSVEEMTSISTMVVHGVVLDAECYWTPDGQQILTYVYLQTTDACKGEAPPVLSFIQLGGRVGDECMGIDGAPTFEIGEEVVVFLRRMISNKPLPLECDLWLLGLGQGKWTVTTDEVTGAETARIALDGAHVIERAGRRLDRELPLAELSRRVCDAATAAAADIGATTAAGASASDGAVNRGNAAPQPESSEKEVAHDRP